MTQAPDKSPIPFPKISSCDHSTSCSGSSSEDGGRPKRLLSVPKLLKNGKLLQMGGGLIVRFWGEKSLQESVSSKNSFGGVRKWDWSGLCQFFLRKMTGRGQTGGGGKACFPLPRFFHPPLPPSEYKTIVDSRIHSFQTDSSHLSYKKSQT